MKKLLSRIYNTEKKIITTNLFERPIKISLLSFIGATDYFITEFGAIWNRHKSYTNRKGLLTKYFQPLVYKDYYYPYPWVLIPFVSTEIWFPISQLLGWAFQCPELPIKQYFLPYQDTLLPLQLSHMQWMDIPPFTPKDSKYLEFIDLIYG